MKSGGPRVNIDRDVISGVAVAEVGLDVLLVILGQNVFEISDPLTL